MIEEYRKAIKRIADAWSESYDDPYFGRWQETPFHHPADNENYDYEPAGLLTQPLDMGDQAIEMVKQTLINPNKKHKKKKKSPESFENS
jgi:hypothetical protein